MFRKILFVDDDVGLLRVIQDHFSERFGLDTAQCGAHALELLARQNPYAVIVSDYRMPGMDGAEFLARAKRLAKDSVRILFTGHADLEVAIRAINEGEIFRFIPKPCSFEKLENALAAAIEKYDLQAVVDPKRQETSMHSLLTSEEIALLLRGKLDSPPLSPL